MDLTVNEYREFLEDFSFTCSEFKKWLNSVILRGNRVKFPYHMNEIETELKFEDRKVHIMLDIKDQAYQWLENNYWEGGDNADGKWIRKS